MPINSLPASLTRTRELTGAGLGGISRLGLAPGFTLIELMVVVAIIGLVSAVVMPGIGGYFQLTLNSATRELATTIKETYNSTIISGKVNRLVYDFKEGKYWVESGPANALLETKESKEKEERRKRFAKPSDKPPASEFSMNTRVTRKKASLPTGVTFEDVFTQQSTETIKEGLAYTHFFPNGLAEQTIVHLKDTSEHRASLVISPMMGRSDVYDRRAEMKEVEDK